MNKRAEALFGFYSKGSRTFPVKEKVAEWPSRIGVVRFGGARFGYRGVFGHPRVAVAGGKVVLWPENHPLAGQPVEIQERSDRMLELYLRGRRKKIFGDKTLSVAGDPDRPIVIQVLGADSGT
jgi:hypothetical protein